MCGEMPHPASLMILQAIAGSFHLNEAIALLSRIELDEIGKATRIALQIREHAFEDASQVSCGNATQRKLDQRFGKPIPKYKGIMCSLFEVIRREDLHCVLVALKP